MMMSFFSCMHMKKIASRRTVASRCSCGIKSLFLIVLGALLFIFSSEGPFLLELYNLAEVSVGLERDASTTSENHTANSVNSASDTSENHTANSVNSASNTSVNHTVNSASNTSVNHIANSVNSASNTSVNYCQLCQLCHSVNSVSNMSKNHTAKSVNSASYTSENESDNSINSASNTRENHSVNSASERSYKKCDIFNGKWVKDDIEPYYPPSSCPYVDKAFDCHLNGRPDSEYLKWRWQPHGCDIPRLNVTDFLERLRGKKLLFVGDSLNRNMWQSLVCILRNGVADKSRVNRVYKIYGKHEFENMGVHSVKFEDYNCTVDFVTSHFLVKQSSFGISKTLRLDLMDGTTSMYHEADVIIFNTGHWWNQRNTHSGKNYFQVGNYVHPRLEVLKAYTRALSTWARWVNKNIDSSKTEVVFRGYSIEHFRGGPWNAGGHCNHETEPIMNGAYLANNPVHTRIAEKVMKHVKVPIMYLNITRLTDYRKDGHPSVYRPDYQRSQHDIQHAQDCGHWCVPGVPDTWNELLYVSLLKTGRGSWRS